MSHSAPFRQRPNLHLALAQSTGSPRQSSQSTQHRTPNATPVSTPNGTPLGPSTPFATTSYSPLRSAGQKLPTPYGSSLSLPPRRLSRTRRGQRKWLAGKRPFASRSLLLLVLFTTLLVWLLFGGRKGLHNVKWSATNLGRDYLLQRRMQDYQFYPATNPKIHYMGRWTTTPNHLRKDGTFPGVYFDLTVSNTSSLFVTLHNAAMNATSQPSSTSNLEAPLPVTVNPTHFSFHPFPINRKPAAPISLLSRIDQEEFVVLPNATSLVPVCIDSLLPTREYQIRVVAPMIDDGGKGIIEFEGVWLSKGGTLEKVAGCTLGKEYEDGDMLRAENIVGGQKDRASLSEFEKDGVNRFSHSHRHHESEEDLLQANRERRKVVEIITDSPGSFTRKHVAHRTGGGDGLLAGVMGWEYLLGEMFGADHVCIGVDGMCLTQDCVGSNGFPAGIGDVFFRSGPYGTEYFDHSWIFAGYIPDVIVLNIGESDSFSFNQYQEKYNQTLWDLTENFESTYVSLIKGIRRLGYSKHPAIVESERLGSPGVLPHGVPVSIPIFVMRPLRGALEHATQNVVTKLRSDGDRSVFWLDTSGWLDVEAENEDSDDFFLDEEAIPPKMRLTERGNQRVAIFLHTHVCRYLANAGDKCAFLPQEIYHGTSYDDTEASFDLYIETQKEEKLKQLFFGHGDMEGDKVLSD